jgi:SAM-dependent methyltransferase
MTDTIYRRPQDYELEHRGDVDDVAFYGQLVERFEPGRILELACGSGRLTAPLAERRPEATLEVVGVELSESMLALARQRVEDASELVRRRVSLHQGDMRTWTSDRLFDMVLIGCSSITHLLRLEDRLQVWRNARRLLSPGGRFVIDITMPDIRSFGSSLETPPRALLEIDSDREDDSTGERLIRSKTTRYDPYRQRAKVTFVYDKFQAERPVDRYVSDFESHVYYPAELELLFLHTGFTIEHVWADFSPKPPGSRTRELVMVGQAT